MKNRKLISKLIFYYIIGLVLFTVIAYAVHLTLFAILSNDTINPSVEIQVFQYNLLYFSPWYLGTYTILYFLILYVVHKYDVYMVNKLNEKLSKMKGEKKNDEK